MPLHEALSAEEILKKAHAVGQYYGFAPFSALAATKRGEAKTASDELPDFSGDPTAQTVATFLKQCREAGLVANTRQPLFLWHTNIASGRAAPKRASVQFHAIGADRAIADAVVIRALSALAHDLYKQTPVVRLNTMGDKETRARFARELGNYFKKRATSLPEDCITCAKKDVFEAAELTMKRAESHDLPSPTDHLSDASRKRFEDLLEYLETTNTPYELAPNLLSRGPLWSETCFEVSIAGAPVAWGSRYGDLARLIYKGVLPATGAVLDVPSMGPKVAPLPQQRLRFSFVHIGDEAKRLSIQLAEEFKKARVPLMQHIGVESLTEQMYLVEKRNAPYLLIMGRKEALEQSAILRNRATQEETVLPLLGLAERLKAFA